MKKKFVKAMLIMGLFVALAAVHLFITTQNIGLKYKLTEVKLKLNEIKSKNRNLGSQVSALENPAEIERAAKGKLEMFYPEKINYIIVPTSGSARPPGRGTSPADDNRSGAARP